MQMTVQYLKHRNNIFQPLDRILKQPLPPAVKLETTGLANVFC